MATNASAAAAAAAAAAASSSSSSNMTGDVVNQLLEFYTNYFSWTHFLDFLKLWKQYLEVTHLDEIALNFAQVSLSLFMSSCVLYNQNSR